VDNTARVLLLVKNWIGQPDDEAWQVEELGKAEWVDEGMRVEAGAEAGEDAEVVWFFFVPKYLLCFYPPPVCARARDGCPGTPSGRAPKARDRDREASGTDKKLNPVSSRPVPIIKPDFYSHQTPL
jgi:hypothetical protein